MDVATVRATHAGPGAVGAVRPRRAAHVRAAGCAANGGRADRPTRRPGWGTGFVIHSDLDDLDEASVDDAIEEQVAYFEGIGQDQAATPHLVSVFGAYVDDRPVSAGWIYYGERSRFAGLWGAATLPGHRNHGLYTALVAARAQEAIARGVEFLTIDARPMSRPIVERLGFRFMTMTHPLLWHVGANAASR